jgi:EmrB/QacA subfamily drug resistance transporter
VHDLAEDQPGAAYADDLVALERGAYALLRELHNSEPERRRNPRLQHERSRNARRRDRQDPMSEPATPVPALTHRQIMTVLAGLMLGTLVAALSQTVVATALPTIVGELGGQDKLAWVVSAALLTSTASSPIWGKLSDLYGRKLLFQCAIGVFLAGSALCGFAQGIEELIAFRAVQGLGIGGLIALPQAIIGDIVAPRQRGRYQGYVGSVFGIATVAGPLIGGFLVDTLSWRWCFFVAIPIGIAALVVTERVLRLPFPRREHAIDYVGAGLIFGGVGAILLMLALAGKEVAWASAPTYLLAALGLALLGAAVWWERRAPEPIIPPRLFANRTFVLASVAAFAVGAAMFCGIVYLPQYLQIVKNQSPTDSGLLTLPLMVSLLTTSIVSGRVITRTGRYKPFPIAGLALAGIGLFLLSRLHADSSLVSAGLSMAIVGLGIGMVAPVLVLAVQNAVDRRDLAAATSASTFFRSMGGAVGVAVFGALLSHRLRGLLPDLLAGAGAPGAGTDSGRLLGTPDAIHQLPPPVRDAVVEAFAESLQTVFLAAVPFALAGFLVVLFLPELRLRSATDQPQGVAEDLAGDAHRGRPQESAPRVVRPARPYPRSPG